MDSADFESHCATSTMTHSCAAGRATAGGFKDQLAELERHVVAAGREGQAIHIAQNV